LCFVALATALAFGSTALIAAGAVRKYQDDGSDQGTAWREGRLTFNDITTDLSGASGNSEPVSITLSSSHVRPAPRSQEKPAVASNGEIFLVVWADQRDFNDNEWDVYGARVTSDGEVLDPDGIVICTAPDMQWAPGVAAFGSDFFVAWARSFSPCGWTTASAPQARLSSAHELDQSVCWIQAESGLAPRQRLPRSMLRPWPA